MIHHGGRLEALRKRFPDAPEPLIDLSTGINPFSYPIPTIPPEAYTRLPEEGQIRELKEAAATAYRCRDPDLIAVAPGTQLLISSLPRVLPSDHVSVLSPTYAEHAASWSNAGAEVSAITSLDDVPEHGTVVWCNPNNPDGRSVPAADLVARQQTRANQGGLMVVDEAFAEFAEANLSAAENMPQRGLILLRSFGKAYGLAGVRLGFMIAERHIVQRVEEALGPWPVSGISIHIAKAALGDNAWRSTMACRLTRECTALDDLLTSFGFALVGGTSLFRLVRHEEASEVAEKLAQAGILVREFPENPHRLRFGLPPDEMARKRLRKALQAAA